MYPFVYYMDPTYLFVILATVLGLIAQARVQSTFSRYSRVPSVRGISGRQAAAGILQSQGIYSTQIEPVKGALSDHFDPRSNTLRLSEPVYASSSVAALGVAAHECGHVMQRETGYLPMRLRAAIVPVANLGSTLSMPLFLIGLLSNFALLVNLGILFFSLAVLFHVVTLPVELDASRRALSALAEGGYLSEEELPQARKVLRAAAMTYVAAALASLVQLLRLLAISRRRD